MKTAKVKEISRNKIQEETDRNEDPVVSVARQKSTASSNKQNSTVSTSSSSSGSTVEEEAVNKVAPTMCEKGSPVVITS
eukprot:8992038-Lingulodinium_polyedra.AAC.1